LTAVRFAPESAFDSGRFSRSIETDFRVRFAPEYTAGYIVADVERLRVPMQRITDYILERVKSESN